MKNFTGNYLLTFLRCRNEIITYRPQHSEKKHKIVLLQAGCGITGPITPSFMIKKILFVITSDSNMGDLALCQDWIEDLGRERYCFSFAAAENMAAYIDSRDHCFIFQKEYPVRQTILDAVDSFAPHAVIFATNAFWNLSGYTGCKFGEFVLQEGDVDVPVFSFDPFEIGFTHILPQTGAVIPFPAVPDWVYALRYMSVEKATPNALHFYSERIFEKSALSDRGKVIAKWNGDPGRKTIFFPMSRDRFYFIRQNYPGYFAYLAELFTGLRQDQVQVFTIFPEEPPEFSTVPEVISLPLIPYTDFLSLVSAADLYLTDSFISCMVTAFHLETPALVLINSEKSLPLSKHSFLDDRFFPFWVFPYGMDKICAGLEQLFEAEDCYGKAELLNKEEVIRSIRDLLQADGTAARQTRACREWKNKRRQRLPGPHEIISSILDETGSKKLV